MKTPAMGNAPPAGGPVTRASTARLELNIGAPPPADPGLQASAARAPTGLASAQLAVTEPPGPPASSAAVPFPLTDAAPSEGRSPLPSGVSSILSKTCKTCGMRYPAEFRVCPKDAAELVDADAPDDELVGQIVADTYTILRVIGEGGMGRVYEARHMRIGGKRFAVKLLHPEYARMPEVQSRFQREAEAAASIESSHVGDVYDIGRTSDGRPFIVAEFLEGRELADLIRERGALPVPYATRIVRQICRGLDAAHKKGIVHRDMKPENVFLVGDLEQPTAKVIDFGISKVTDASGAPSLTKTGMIMGTPSYMAPEQARGDKVDHRVDVYSVGAILYELCTGQRPFDRSDPTATIMAVLLEEPERPCSLNPALPETLELVIQRAMAKSPDARYSSMRALEDDLAPFAESQVRVGGGGASLSVAPPAAPTAERRDGEVAMSRPTILVLGSLGGLFVLFGLMTLAAGTIRLSRGGGATANLTGLESILLVGLLTLALATPAGFVVHLIRKNVWHNSARTIELARSLKRVVLAAFVSYGLLALTIRFVEALVLRRAAGIAWPVWDLVTVLLAAGGAALTHVVLRPQRG